MHAAAEVHRRLPLPRYQRVARRTTPAQGQRATQTVTQPKQVQTEPLAMSRRQQRSLPAPLGRLSVVVFDALSHSSQASYRHADCQSDRRVAAGGCAASLRGYSHRDAAANAPQPRLRPRQRATGAAAASVRTLEQCARRRFFGGKRGAGGRISGRRQPSGGSKSPAVSGSAIWGLDRPGAGSVPARRQLLSAFYRARAPCKIAQLKAKSFDLAVTL